MPDVASLVIWKKFRPVTEGSPRSVSVPPASVRVFDSALFARFAPWTVKEEAPLIAARIPPPSLTLFVTVSAFVAFAVPAVNVAFATRAPAPTMTVPELPVVRVPFKDPVRLSVPAFTVVRPVWVLLPEMVSVPLPAFVRPPDPLITPE